MRLPLSLRQKNITRTLRRLSAVVGTAALVMNGLLLDPTQAGSEPEAGAGPTSCTTWQLPLSHLHEFSQPTAGTCYAFRDVKALGLLETQISSTGRHRASVVDGAVGRHSKHLRLKQWVAPWLDEADYKKGQSVVDWGYNCEVANFYLENGFCDDPVITSDAFLMLYISVREFTTAYLSTERCSLFRRQSPVDAQFYEFLEDYQTQAALADQGLEEEDREELADFFRRFRQADSTPQLARLAKSLERTVKRRCSGKRTPAPELKSIRCEGETYIGSLSREDWKKPAEVLSKKLLEVLGNATLTVNGKSAQSPVMAGYCSMALEGSPRPSERTYGSILDNCSGHAVLISGSRANPTSGQCEVLIENNYGDSCDPKGPAAAHMTCELDTEGKNTGRVWVDMRDFAATLTSLSRFTTGEPSETPQ